MSVVLVGRPRSDALATASRQYEQRAARYWTLDVKEVREERGTDAASVRRREAERLLHAIGARPFIACEEGGRSYDSRGFADLLREARDAARDLSFVIGGAFGLDRSVTDAAGLRLSLAPWTLPHELARVVLVEQIYRAGTILRGEPYHK